MVITRLIGGLGNQLFQYALGGALAEKRATTPKLDVSGFQRNKLHAYALHPFNIPESFATRDEIRRLRGGGWIAGQLPRRLQKLNPLRKGSSLMERSFSLDPGVLKAPDHVYLDGYWQSEKYFTSTESILRSECTVRHPLAGRNQEMASRIAACNAVSVHVRRGARLNPNPDKIVIAAAYWLANEQHDTHHLFLSAWKTI